MKTHLYTAIVSSAILLTASVAFAAAPDRSKAAAKVTFHEPEQFTDFKTSEMFRNGDADMLQAELARAIERAASAALPPGYVLSIRFNDIDLAGEVNPFHRLNMRDIREYRGVYPPRLSFDYAVTDAEGAEVLSGTERLVELGYDMQIRMPNSDYTRVESDMMRDFVRKLGRTIASGKA